MVWCGELLDCRWQLDMVDSLDSAWNYLSKTEPDFMIIDLMLPDGRGLDLLPGEGVKSNYPIIMYTGHDDEEMASDAKRAGAADYIVKSQASLLSLPSIVDTVLREWRLNNKSE